MVRAEPYSERQLRLEPGVMDYRRSSLSSSLICSTGIRSITTAQPKTCRIVPRLRLSDLFKTRRSVLLPPGDSLLIQSSPESYTVRLPMLSRSPTIEADDPGKLGYDLNFLFKQQDGGAIFGAGLS